MIYNNNKIYYYFLNQEQAMYSSQLEYFIVNGKTNSYFAGQLYILEMCI